MTRCDLLVWTYSIAAQSFKDIAIYYRDSGIFNVTATPRDARSNHRDRGPRQHPKQSRSRVIQ
jgi:hypothetical protein